MAETARREGAPGQGVRAEGGPDPEQLLAVQQQILTNLPPGEPVAATAPGGAELKNRRFTGVKRAERVGPLRFEPDQEARLGAAAAANGYRGVSGFAADVVLAFTDGRFFIDLPLAEERRQTHHFRARVLRLLSGVSNNVNQIARALNSGYEPTADIRHTLVELRHLLEQIAEALRQSADQEV
ncbi:MobC family plasmid mobilization relaxosome protein [Streptantibioticus silvisoli]|uniref:MobC family plasmid mobilization relaxosome protein n=1 Tax=Streptantibioticus silvisoli TaxID=2705255 RepID=A0ABT6VWS5_9ACTN|nr:MobC family plasmid mobilization relaxosome protein [Streptantibioticus silvisoli]MDI5962938.1 MobC family plasmid mobilization relaxosome protein [Streptantibioticus silvisoli]